MTKATVENAITTNYGRVAESGLSSDQQGIRAVAQAFGYAPHELESIPTEANMGLSCGNPTATANLKAGEVVIDLGCGGGLDVFLAAAKVGPSGKAIGIDMTPQMIDLARKNARHGTNGNPVTNVEFHLAKINQLPLAAGTVDCIISNCVINLAPDKPAVFSEISRVLKPGGRVAISDIALKKRLPADLKNNISAHVGCIGGAISIEDYEKGLRDAGLEHLQIIDSCKDLNAYAQADNQSACCSPTMDSSTLPIADSNCCAPQTSTPVEDLVHAQLTQLLNQYDINEYAASVYVYAIKP